MPFTKIAYASLNSRQKETYNFQKVSAILADYGFATIPLNDDWQGADFIAQHVDGDTFLTVQLKGRFMLAKMYVGKSIWMCFPLGGDFYLFEHDVVLAQMLERYGETMARSTSWVEGGAYSWGKPGRELRAMLEGWRL